MMDQQVKQQIEETCEACQLPIDEVECELKRAVRERLEQLGFVIEFPKEKTRSKDRTIIVFDLDRMISIPQVRNGLIRSQYNFMRHVEGLNSVKCKMKLIDRYSRLRAYAVQSYEMIHDIIYNKR